MATLLMNHTASNIATPHVNQFWFTNQFNHHLHREEYGDALDILESLGLPHFLSWGFMPFYELLQSALEVGLFCIINILFAYPLFDFRCQEDVFHDVWMYIPTIYFKRAVRCMIKCSLRDGNNLLAIPKTQILLQACCCVRFPTIRMLV